MANTTKVTSNAITVTFDGTTDWSWSADTPFEPGLRVRFIHFHPGAAGDVMVVREYSQTGAELFRCKCAGEDDDRIQYLQCALVRPVVKVSECTLGAPSDARLTLLLG